MTVRRAGYKATGLRGALGATLISAGSSALLLGCGCRYGFKRVSAVTEVARDLYLAYTRQTSEKQRKVRAFARAAILEVQATLLERS